MRVWLLCVALSCATLHAGNTRADSFDETDRVIRNASILLCARHLTRLVFLDISRRAGILPGELSSVLESPRNAAQRLVDAMDKSADNFLSKYLHTLIVMDDETKGRVIRDACLPPDGKPIDLMTGVRG